MDLEELGCKDIDLIRLSQDRVQLWALLNRVMDLRVL
jgi:hypothetical protein